MGNSKSILFYYYSLKMGNNEAALKRRKTKNQGWIPDFNQGKIHRRWRRFFFGVPLGKHTIS
jgi:hypothetical protein